LDFNDFISRQSMCLAMDRFGSFFTRRFHQADDDAFFLVVSVTVVLYLVLSLDFQIASVGVSHGLGSQSINILVDIYVKWHFSISFLELC
jgi:hypothetical protein